MVLKILEFFKLILTRHICDSWVYLGSSIQ